MKSTIIIKKALIVGILALTLPSQAGWIPNWLSNICPTFTTKNVTFFGVGTIALAGTALAGYLCYQRYYGAKTAPIGTVTTNIPEEIDQQEALAYLTSNHKDKEKEKEAEINDLFISFDEWKIKCAALPSYKLPEFSKVETTSLEKDKEKEDDDQKPQQTNYRDERNNETKLSAHELDTILTTYFESLTKDSLFKNQENWVKNELPEQLFESLQNERPVVFDPFVQKIVLDKKSIVAFHGDIHGDIYSLNAFLNKLHNEQYLDNFKIINPNFYMVFLGDYTDRGWYGAEVIYTILRLKIANPDRVFLVRGNHEEKGQNKPEQFHESFANNFYDQLIHKFTKEEAEALFSKIQKMYETLPLALYLGSGTEIHKDFILCCHGGIEIGFDPHALLNHEQTISYTKLGTLDRIGQIEKLKQEQHQALLNLFTLADPTIKTYGDFLQRLLGFENLPIYPHLKKFEPKNIITQVNAKFYVKPGEKNPQTNLYIGFQWNDYSVNPILLNHVKLQVFALRSSTGRGWTMSKTFNEAALGLQSNDKNTVHGVFRAHQHTSSPHDLMMQRILNTDHKDHDTNIGVGKLWIEQQTHEHENQKGKEKGDTQDPHALWENIVCTFNVCPHTPYQKAGFNFDTYGLLTLGTEYTDWKLEIVRQQTLFIDGEEK